MKKVILIYQIIHEKFAYGELFMLVMIGYIFMFKMVTKMQSSGLEMVAGLTRPLIFIWALKVLLWKPGAIIVIDLSLANMVMRSVATGIPQKMD